MQSKSGSRGKEYARTHEARQVRIVRRVEAETQERTPTWARAWAQAEAEAQAGMWAQAEVWTRAQAKVQAGVWERAQAQAQAEVKAEVWERARAWARAQAEAQEEVWERAEVWEQARARALIRALARARAGMVEKGEIPLKRATALLTSALNEGGVTPFLPPESILPHPYAPAYAEVLADLKIKGILDSIEPNYRHGLARNLWVHSEHWWLVQIVAPVTRLPPELLQSVLSTIIDDASDSPLVLMLVCKHWYDIVTGMWAPLKLGTRTPKDAITTKLERNQWLLDIVVDTEIDRGDFTPSEAAYEAIFAAIEATARWRSLVVETFPGQTDLPEHLVNRGLQRCSNETMSRFKTFKVKCACEMSPLLDRLLRILGTTASPELTTVEINSVNVISFLVPTYSLIFRSVKVLFLDISGTHDPVDLLPHLHQLEELTASHLSLPIYADHISLPFVNTLRHLRLRAVSIQWMSGKTFDVLESCTIRFPLHRHLSPIFSTSLPNCKDLTFQGYPLDILGGVSAHKLIHLAVTSSGSFNRRGEWQLAWFSSRVLGESRLAPRVLHISIEATSQAWMNALSLMPHLEELVIENTHPSSFGLKVLQSFIAQPVHANKPRAISATREWRAPLCPLLKRFGLKYRRWLRTSEHFDLIPNFLSIVWWRRHSNCALQSFRVWTRGDQEDPLELVEESRISFNGLYRLVNESGIKGENVLDLVLMRLMQVTFKPSGGPFNPFS